MPSQIYAQNKVKVKHIHVFSIILCRYSSNINYILSTWFEFIEKYFLNSFWNPNRKCSAFADFTLNIYGPSHHLNKSFCDRQAQASATLSLPELTRLTALSDQEVWDTLGVLQNRDLVMQVDEGEAWRLRMPIFWAWLRTHLGIGLET